MFQHVLFEHETYATILGTRNSLALPPRPSPSLYLVCFCRLGVDMIIVLITSVLIEDLLHECLNTSTLTCKQINKKLSMIIKSKNYCLDAADRQIVFEELHNRLLLPVLALACVVKVVDTFDHNDRTLNI